MLLGAQPVRPVRRRPGASRGPAPQPLAAILLDYDAAADELYAVGTLGGEVFDAFFAKYEFRLGLEYGGKAKAAVEGTCVVNELERYCRQQVKC